MFYCYTYQRQSVRTRLKIIFFSLWCFLLIWGQIYKKYIFIHRIWITYYFFIPVNMCCQCYVYVSFIKATWPVYVNYLLSRQEHQGFEETSQRLKRLEVEAHPKTHTHTPTRSFIQRVTFCLVTAIVARTVTTTETVWPCWLGQRLERRVEKCCQVITKIHKLSLLITAWAAGDHTEQSMPTLSNCIRLLLLFILL